MSEVAKALDESRLITKSYQYAEVDVILAGDEVVEDKRLFYKPLDSEIEEYHPKATKTLFVGGLNRDVAESAVREMFGRFGEILDVDIKKSPAAAMAAASFAALHIFAGCRWTSRKLSTCCLSTPNKAAISSADSPLAANAAQAHCSPSAKPREACGACGRLADVVASANISAGEGPGLVFELRMEARPFDIVLSRLWCCCNWPLLSSDFVRSTLAAAGVEEAVAPMVVTRTLT